MRTQFKFTQGLICTPEYFYTPKYIYTRVFFAHANWTWLFLCSSLKQTLPEYFFQTDGGQFFFSGSYIKLNLF